MCGAGKLGTVPVHTYPALEPYAIAHTPNGRYLVVTCQKGGVYLIDPATGEAERLIRPAGIQTQLAPRAADVGSDDEYESVVLERRNPAPACEVPGRTLIDRTIHHMFCFVLTNGQSGGGSGGGGGVATVLLRDGDSNFKEFELPPGL